MDFGRLDTLRHSLSEAPSRRGIGRAFAALTFSGGVAALVGLGGSEAKKKCKKRKEKKCPKPAFCTGKNTCFPGESVRCDSDGDEPCSCLIAAETGAPFCTGNTSSANACTECPEDRTCVYTGPECGFGPFGCALPCPNPL